MKASHAKPAKPDSKKIRRTTATYLGGRASTTTLSQGNTLVQGFRKIRHAVLDERVCEKLAGRSIVRGVRGGDEGALLFWRQQSDRTLPNQRGRSGFVDFAVAHPNRAAAARIARTASVVMLREAAFQIVRDAGIQRAVPTFDDIKVPGAVSPRCRCGHSLRASWEERHPWFEPGS